MHRSVFLSLAISTAACVFPASAQTFTDFVFDQETYSFHTEESGQYEATLTWDKLSTNDVLALALLCNDDTGDPMTHGVAVGSRARVVRLNVGITGEKECFLGVQLMEGFSAEYTLNLSMTSPLAIAKTSRRDLPAPARELFDEIRHRLRSFRSSQSGSPAVRGAEATPTRTVLDQLQGGAPRTFTFDVTSAGSFQLTAMWNRADTDLHVSMACSDDSGSLDFGRSESGQERFLRFDTGIPPGLSCEVTAESPTTMVYAMNFAVYGAGDLELFACIPRSQCCLFCDTGKACGDSCISRSSTCHQPPGCACNLSEVCP